MTEPTPPTVRPFGFTVKRATRTGSGPDDWCVFLPHQCEDWDITGDGEHYAAGPPHAEAVADLAAFIAEAQNALDALKERREVLFPGMTP